MVCLSGSIVVPRIRSHRIRLRGATEEGATVENRVSTLVEAVAAGDRQALDELFPLVYEELGRLAHQQRRRWDGDFTLTTTALVHEAYLKLAGQRQLPTENRAHFLGVASRAMRHILCNYARDRRRQKRGGGQPHLPLDRADPADGTPLDLSDDQADRLAGLDEALRRFEAIAERQCRVVECRFFGGMSVEETAAALGVSPRSVKRDWAFARAWLLREMQLTLAGES
jgi:RNA polymerase sigma factor (TIGR02999 family)